MLQKINRHFEICLVFLVGLGLRLYAAWVDPFLHDWDERFHALVARNLLDNPWVPMMKKVVLEIDPNKHWCCNHIWLHKQPLFLWQMALSMKLFGVSEFTLRLPSVLMGSLMILMLYRIGMLLTRNKIAALVSASLLAFSNFQLQLISGLKGMDHNDVALGFYVMASLWALAEYVENKKFHWILWIGIFAGCAILNKWLLGLSVYLVWGIYLLVNFYKEKNGKGFLAMAISLTICCAVFLPWQIYILHQWPDLANKEYEFNQKHITEALEGHGGAYWFYWDIFPSYLGGKIWMFFPFGILISTFKNYPNKLLLNAILILYFFVFFFFSFVVKTKVDAHFFFVVPIMILFIGIGVSFIFEIIKNKYFSFLSLLLLLYFSLNPLEIKNYLSADNLERENKIYNTKIFKSLRNYLPADILIVANTSHLQNTELMFYQNDLMVNDFWIDEKVMQAFAKRKIKVAVFRPNTGNSLPEFILDYPYHFVIPIVLK